MDKLFKKQEREKKRKRTIVTRQEEGVSSANRPIVIHSDDGGNDEQNDDNGAGQTRRNKTIKKNTSGSSDSNADVSAARSESPEPFILPHSPSRNGRPDPVSENHLVTAGLCFGTSHRRSGTPCWHSLSSGSREVSNMFLKIQKNIGFAGLCARTWNLVY